MLVHLSGDDVGIKLGDKASRAVRLDYFYHTLVDIPVSQYLLFERICVYPLGFGKLIPVLGVIVVVEFVVKEFLNEFIEFLLRTSYVENETLVLFHVRVVCSFTKRRLKTLLCFLSLQRNFRLWVNNIKMWELLWHLLDIKVPLSLILIITIVNIEHVIIVSQSLLEFWSILAHEHLWP